MNLKFIITVYLKELKESLRDRRTLISTIVIPTVAMPLLFFIVAVAAQKIHQKTESQSSTVMILGASDTTPLIASIKAAQDSEKKMSLFKVLPTTDDYRQQISDKKVRAVLELPANFDVALKAGEPLKINIYHYSGEPASGLAVQRLQDLLGKLRTKTIETRLVEHSLPVTLVKPFEVVQQNVAPPEKVGGNAFGGIIPYVIILLCFTGAMYPAIDLTAGEKERGTMETLLCSPVNRLNLVLGKFLMVVTASVSSVVFSLVSMGVTAFAGVAYFGGGAGRIQAAQQAAAKAAGGGMLPTIDPVGLLGVFALVAPVAVLFAAVLLTISLFAKSYKEAQSYVSPLIIVVIMPAMLGIMPGIELTAKTALIPILNLSLACKEMLSGVWHWNYIALIFGSTGLYAAIAVALCVKMFNRESVMFRA